MLQASNMSADNFIIHEHAIPAQHIRELPNALAVDEGTPEATLYLSVKQYIPKNNINPQRGDITIVGFHANGYNKEIYEPLWDDLLLQLSTTTEGIRIRGIWMTDVASQGQSYIMNEQKLADGISWDDHARDVLHLINVHRDQMVPPLVGIGHSMGAIQLLELCRIHPRLFHSVAFLEPWLSLMTKAQSPEQLRKRSMARNKVYGSIEAAREAHRKVPLHRTWDPRCFDRYMDTAFRQLPTLLHDTNDSGLVPTTPAIMTFHSARRVTSRPIDMNPQTASRLDRLAYPDRIYDFPIDWAYCMPQAIEKARHLPHLRPRVLFLYGGTESVIPLEQKPAILQTTGTDSGGSGGKRLGCVEEDVVTGGHFFPFDNPRGTAARLGTWLQKEQMAWRREKAMLDERYGHGADAERRQHFPPDFEEIARVWATRGSSKL